MNFVDIFIICGIIIISLCMIISVGYHIYKFFHRPYTEPDYYPQPVAVPATVAAKWVYLKNCGSSRMPDSKIIYVAEFLTYTNQTLKFEIPQDVYNSLLQNQKGTLVTIENNFFVFE